MWPESTALADGLKLIAARGRLMQRVSGRGAMAAVMAGEEQVREALEGLAGQVSLAAVNAPQSVVISGYEDGVAIAEERLKKAGVRVERLRVSHGFHSPQMAEMRASIRGYCGRDRLCRPSGEAAIECDGGERTATRGYPRRVLAAASTGAGAVSSGDGGTATVRTARIYRSGAGHNPARAGATVH